MPKPVTRETKITVAASKSISGKVVIEKNKSESQPGYNTEDLKNPAYVGVDISITKNMENYESLKIGVNICSPCKMDDKEESAARDMEIAMAILTKEAEELSKEWF